MGKRICVIDDCPKVATARGWCQMHYMRWWTHGDPLTVKRFHGTAEERFWRAVDASGVCWEWTGFLTEGYGRFQPSVGQTVSTHLWAYRTLVGPVPDGMELDHRCRNRCCVNPDHLQPVTKVINILRGGSPHAVNARKTHCPKGHAYDDVNTINDRNVRRCRTCRRATCREATRRLRERRRNRQTEA